VQWGFIAGILIGVVIGCATFALERLAHTIPSNTASTARNTQFARPLSRGPGGACRAWRQDPGPQPAELSVLRLGQPLYQHVKALLARHPECRFLLFDFKLVTGIDSSAAYSFAQIKRTAQDPRHQTGAGCTFRLRPRRSCDRASSFRMRCRSCPNWITRWSGWRERNHRAESGASEQEKHPCATGFTRILGTETGTPRI